MKESAESAPRQRWPVPTAESFEATWTTSLILRVSLATSVCSLSLGLFKTQCSRGATHAISLYPLEAHCSRGRVASHLFEKTVDTHCVRDDYYRTNP